MAAKRLFLLCLVLYFIDLPLPAQRSSIQLLCSLGRSWSTQPDRRLAAVISLCG